MRFIFALSFLILSACSQGGSTSSSPKPCNANGVAYVTTEQRMVSNDMTAQTRKTYKMSDLRSSQNFYGHRYAVLQNGNVASDYFQSPAQLQEQQTSFMTVDWQNEQLISKDSSGKEESTRFFATTKDVQVNLSLGGQASVYEIPLSAADQEQARQQAQGKSGNGVTICSAENTELFMAKSDQAPSEMLFIVKMKLNIMVDGQ